MWDFSPGSIIRTLLPPQSLIHYEKKLDAITQNSKLLGKTRSSIADIDTTEECNTFNIDKLYKKIHRDIISATKSYIAKRSRISQNPFTIIQNIHKYYII